ncbi:hypothetical protein CWI69_07140 [Pseudidiomarina halophila]|uniref:Uncharacterized protein n=1 Tax=Pseudidiomarina halophila TaxID=1449799 RepID=A0A432XVR4_9GAMM|nr:hypothetical protein CWI69_07140 [Pseudidiomarina halophila]
MLSVIKKYLITVGMSGLLFGCGQPSTRIAYHLPLSQYNAEALILEENYGATTSFVYKLYICDEERVGMSKCGKELLVVDKLHLSEIDVRLGGETLIVSLPDIARVHHFSNFWYSKGNPLQHPVPIELEFRTANTLNVRE